MHSLHPKAGSVVAVSLASAFLLLNALGAEAAPAGPPLAKVRRVMAHVHEIQNPAETFRPTGSPVALRLKSGRVLSAVIGVRSPTADGYGQLVFFFLDRKFVGLSSQVEATAIRSLVAGAPHQFRVGYATYAPGAPTYAPRSKPLWISYRWEHGRIVASRPIPKSAANGIRVHWVKGSPAS